MVVQHTLRGVKQHLDNSDERFDFEANALKQALQAYIPVLQKMSGLGEIVNQVGIAVDAFLFLVRHCYSEHASHCTNRTCIVAALRQAVCIHNEHVALLYSIVAVRDVSCSRLPTRDSLQYSIDGKNTF